MSLVGTRPPTVDEWDKYELHHRARLATKPGLTGMWQVSGRSNITDFEEVVKLDKQYISEWTMQFPFRIENNDIQNGIRIYDSVTGILINATTLSFLIGLFEQINRPETDFEKVFEIMMESEQNDDEFTIEQMWTLFSYLLKYDLGYIRYDIDPEHENGKLHPLHHLDICLDSSATYKIGLNQEIRFDNFKDILDTATESWYIYRGQN